MRRSHVLCSYNSLQHMKAKSMPQYQRQPAPWNTRSSFAASSLLAGLIASIGLSGCVAPPQSVIVRERVVERAPSPQSQIRAMPAPVREDRGPSPGPGFNWLPGHWHWAGNDWAWAQGHWVRQVVAPMPPLIVEEFTVAPSPRQFWVPGHWVWRPDIGSWAWNKGAWHG